MVAYKAFAWISAVLLFYNFSLFPLRRLFRKNKNAAKFLRYGSIVHRYTGIALLITAITHGYLALGGLYWHTGLLLWLGVVVLFAYYLLRKIMRRRWLLLHRYTDFVVIGLFFLHFFFPWIF